MALYLGCVFGPGLDHVRVKRSLHEEASIFDLVPRNLLEHPDERLPDDLAFRFGIGDPTKLLEEAVGRFDVDQVDLQMATEGLFDLFGLARAQQAVIYEDARELI